MDPTWIPKIWPWYDLIFGLATSKNIHLLTHTPVPRHSLLEKLPNEVLYFISDYLYMEDVVNIVSATPSLGSAFSSALGISTETDADLPDTFIATKNGIKYWYTITRYKQDRWVCWKITRTHMGIVNSRTVQGIKALKGACGMKNLAVMRFPQVTKFVVLSEALFALLDSTAKGDGEVISPLLHPDKSATGGTSSAGVRFTLWSK